MERRAGAGRAVRTMAVLLGLLSAGSCLGKLGRAPDPFTTRPHAGTGAIEVEVQSLNFNDASIFAIRQGERIRLGTVTGKSDQTFTLDWNFALPLQFEAQLVGGRSCRVQELMVDPGDRLWLRIPVEVSITPCRVGKR